MGSRDPENLIQIQLIQLILSSNFQNSFDKSFAFDWNRTRVTTLASLQRWPLGHPVLISRNILIVY